MNCLTCDTPIGENETDFCGECRMDNSLKAEMNKMHDAITERDALIIDARRRISVLERQRDALVAALEYAEMYYVAMFGYAGKLCPHGNTSCGACHVKVIELRNAALAAAREG